MHQARLFPTDIDYFSSRLPTTPLNILKLRHYSTFKSEVQMKSLNLTRV